MEAEAAAIHSSSAEADLRRLPVDQLDVLARQASCEGGRGRVDLHLYEGAFRANVDRDFPQRIAATTDTMDRQGVEHLVREHDAIAAGLARLGEHTVQTGLREP